MLPFTIEQFIEVFVHYNQAIWPAQIVAYALGAVAVALLFWRLRAGGSVIALILAAMWLWTGIFYHWLFFSPLNNAAFGFAALFVLQGLYLAVIGIAGRIQFEVQPGPAAWVGAIFILYAAILYPLIGMWTGHAYSALPMFGVTPCPVTIFTFGMFLLARPPLSYGLLVIPFIWSLIGGSAAILLNVPQDWLLLVSGMIAVPLIVRRRRAQAT